MTDTTEVTGSRHHAHEHHSPQTCKNFVRSQILIDAIHYMKKFEGDIFVIKFSGDILRDGEIMDAIAQDLILLNRAGIKPVAVHGGRLAISEVMEKLGMKPKMVNGLRVTDDAAMAVVDMVLRKVGGDVSRLINKHHGKSVDLSGTAANLFVAEKRKSEIDLGRVGDIKCVNPKIIKDLLNENYIPVVSSVAVDALGNTLNVNADTVAGELAAALGSSKLILLTNVPGVLDEKGELIKRIIASEIDELINSKKVTGGMIPKLLSCKLALEGGVPRTHIVKASEHGILEEVLTSSGMGTMVTLEKVVE